MRRERLNSRFCPVLPIPVLPNTGGVGHCQWNPSYDDSACTCDTTTEYPVHHIAVFVIQPDTQTRHVWAHTNYTLGMTCLQP